METTAKMEIQKNKLWLKGVFPERSDEEIRRFCDQYGKSVHMSRPNKKDYVFLTYITEEDALRAQANFIRSKYTCRFAKVPQYAYDTDSTLNSSPTSSDSSPTNSAASTDPESSRPQTTSPNRHGRRVHFSTDVVTTSPPNSSNQRSNGAAKSNHVKAVFKNGEKIIITYVQSASSFYAHSVSKDKERQDLIKKISQLAKRIDYVKELPKFMALAPYKQTYYRAIIKRPASDEGNLVLVTLVDIGISLNVPCDKLKPIPNEYTTIKISNRFILDGVDDDTNESYAAKCLSSYIGIELTMECDGTVERLGSVRLKHPETKQNVNHQIKQMQKSFNEDELVRVPAPVGANQKVVTVDDSILASGDNLITLIEATNLPEFTEQNKRVQAVGNEMKMYPPYVPTEGELCLVLYTGQWHRAVFIKKSTNSDDGADDTLVLLIDLCKGVLINSKSIRHITDELVHISILSFLGDIKGYDQTIDKAKVGDLLQKFKKMTKTCVKSICESSDPAIRTIDI